MDGVHRLATRGPTASARMLQRRHTLADERFAPLPAPLGSPPYRLALGDVIGSAALNEVAAAGRLRFHSVGDTGGWRDLEPQRRVAAAMAAELSGADPARFFFHLGDVVYPHGEREHYRDQFDGAYRAYGAPILAVPGNHDAENDDLEGELALAPFLGHFCCATAPLHEAGVPARAPVRQPHVHFTLVHEWLRIVGLWANVPEGGQFAPEQLDWLIGELGDTPDDVTLILALHQPVYSADVTHGGNLALVDLLDACAREAGRGPDAVFSGHAHLYERFTRVSGGRAVPFIVAGAGGYPELHELAAGVGSLPARFPGVPEVTLDACEDRAHGFMTVTARPGGADVAYTAVGPAGAESARVVDRFTLAPPATRGRRLPRSVTLGGSGAESASAY
jgi:predicted phosphodiesterase